MDVRFWVLLCLYLLLIRVACPIYVIFMGVFWDVFHISFLMVASFIVIFLLLQSFNIHFMEAFFKSIFMAALQFLVSYFCCVLRVALFLLLLLTFLDEWCIVSPGRGISVTAAFTRNRHLVTIS